jgi:uncharacterized protein
MPSALTYPGVYIEEVPSNVRTVIGASTSIAAFVGRTQRGPVGEPIVINSFADFERRFGGLWKDSPLSFAVRDFYLNGGSQAVIVRLYVSAIDSATSEAQTAAQAVADAAADAEAAAANATAVATAAKTAATDAGKAGATAKAAADAVAKAIDDQAISDTADKAAAVQAGADAVEPAVTAATASVDKTGASRIVADSSPAGKPTSFEAASPGSWGDTLRVRVLNSASGVFDLEVRDTASKATERYIGVTVAAGPRNVADMLKAESQLLRVAGSLPDAAPGNSADPKPGVDPWADPTGGDPETYYKVGDKGDDGPVLGDADFTPPGAAAAKTGLYALDKAEAFNLLCIPPHALGGSIGAGLIDAALAYCTLRRAVMLIDPPADWTSKEKALAGIDAGVGSASANGVLYFPRIVAPNPLNQGREEAFVPCGAVAGLYARIDAQRGVWKAPAGLEATLVGAPKLSVSLTDMENGELNPKGINCLRALPGAGRVVWGARTRRGDDRLADQWKYVPVRRTALFIEESLYHGTQWVVFEPNDEPLWASIRLNVGAFMQGLFRQGAFAGATPAEAYFVKCDKDTNPQADVDKGIVNILVGFAPLKPAEFVVIKLSQITNLEIA